MANSFEIVKNLFEKHIEGTPEKAVVAYVTVSICKLTNTVGKEMKKSLDCDNRVYINTRVLKHLYDRKPAEEFNFVISKIHKIVKYPDHIYKNKNPKRGDVCLVKKIGNESYLCSLELCDKELCVVT